MSPITRRSVKELSVEEIADLPVGRRTRRSIYITLNDGETVISRRKSHSPVGTDKENVTTPKKNNKPASELNGGNLKDQEGTPKQLPRTRSCSTSKKLSNSIANKANSDNSSPQRNLRSHYIVRSCTPRKDSKFKRNLVQDLSESEISVSENGIESGNEITSVKSEDKKLSKIPEENSVKQVEKKISNTVTKEKLLTTLNNKFESNEHTIHDGLDGEEHENNETYNLKHNVMDVEEELIPSKERTESSFGKRIINMEKLKESESSTNNLDRKCEGPGEKTLQEKGKTLQECGETGQKNLPYFLREKRNGNINSKKENDAYKVQEDCKKCEVPKEDGSSIIQEKTSRASKRRHSEHSSSEVLSRNISNKLCRGNMSQMFCMGNSSKVLSENYSSEEHRKVDSSEEHHEDNASEEHHKDNASEEHHKDNASEEHHKDNASEEHHKDNASEEHHKDNASEQHHKDNASEVHFEDDGKVHGKDGASEEHRKDDATEVHHKDDATEVHHKDGATEVHHKDGATEVHHKDGASEEHCKDDASEVRFKDDADEVRHEEHCEDNATEGYREDDADEERCKDDAGEDHHKDDAGVEHRKDVAGEEHRKDVAGEEHRKDVAGEVHCKEDDTNTHRKEDDSEVHCKDNATKVHGKDNSNNVHCKDGANEMQSEADASEQHGKDVTGEVRHEGKGNETQKEDYGNETDGVDVGREVQHQDNVSEVHIDTNKFHQSVVNDRVRCDDVNEVHPEESEEEYDEHCVENVTHSTVSDDEDEFSYPPSAQCCSKKYVNDCPEKVAGEKINAIDETLVPKKDITRKKKEADCVVSGVNVEGEREQSNKLIVQRKKDIINASEEGNMAKEVIKGDAGNLHCQTTESHIDNKFYKTRKIAKDAVNVDIISEKCFDKEVGKRRKVDKKKKVVEMEGEEEEDMEKMKRDMEEDMGKEKKDIVEEEEDADEEEEDADEEEEGSEEEEENTEEDTEEEEEEADNRRKKKSRALQFIDFEAEEEELDFDEEEEECEEEEEEDDEDDYSESESEKDSTDINIRDYARKFLNDEAIDENWHKKKRKRMVIESDEEVGNTSLKELSVHNKSTSSVEETKEKFINDSSRCIEGKIESNPAILCDNSKETENTVTECLNVLEVCDNTEKDNEKVFSTIMFDEQVVKLSEVEKEEVQERVLESSCGSFSSTDSEVGVRKIKVTVGNNETRLNKGDNSLVEEIFKDTKIREMKLNDSDTKSEEALETYKLNSVDALKADLILSKYIGKTKSEKKSKGNKECALNLEVQKDFKTSDKMLTNYEKAETETAPENKQKQKGSDIQTSKASDNKIEKRSINKSFDSIDNYKKLKRESSKSEVMEKTSKKSINEMEIAVCNESTQYNEKDKCHITEILDTKILDDENIYKNEDIVLTSADSMEKERLASEKSINIGEEKKLKKRKKEYAPVSDVLQSKTPDKMLTSPEKTEKQIIPMKKQKLMGGNIDNIITFGKKKEKYTFNNRDEWLVDEKSIMQNDKLKKMIEETSTSKSAPSSWEVKDKFLVDSIKNESNQQLPGKFNFFEKSRGKCAKRKPTKRDNRITEFVANSNQWIVTNISRRERKKVSVGVWDIKEIKKPKLEETCVWNDSIWVVNEIDVPLNCEWIVTDNVRQEKETLLTSSGLGKNSVVCDKSKMKDKIPVVCCSGEWNVKDLRQRLKLHKKGF